MKLGVHTMQAIVQAVHHARKDSWGVGRDDTG
jgi:hypothetical protein